MVRWPIKPTPHSTPYNTFQRPWTVKYVTRESNKAQSSLSFHWIAAVNTIQAKNQLAAPPTAPETPRRRKDNISQCLRGINTNLPLSLSLTSIRSHLIAKLSLLYTPDDWQIHLIRRILQGYDSIFCAGTGYGKSLIFEGLAVLGGNGKLVIVISPLKALEYDQVSRESFTQFLTYLFHATGRPSFGERHRNDCS